MVGTLDEFRSQLLGGGARNNQYRVEINNPPAGAVGLVDASSNCVRLLLRDRHPPQPSSI